MYDTKDIYRVYKKYKGKLDMYSSIYQELENVSDMEINAIKADLLARLEVANQIGAAVAVVSIIMSFSAILFNIVKVDNNIVIVVTVIGAILILLIYFAGVMGNELLISNDSIKRDRYILSVIEDIKNRKI